MPPTASVVLVNGLWLGNVALGLLARRLRRAGLDVHRFSYPTTRNDLRANAALLERFLAAVPGEVVHLVGYSLGGLVIRALFRFHAVPRPGRIVLLGSPQVRSRAAEALARRPPTAALVGRSLGDLIAGLPQSWAWPRRDTGVLAGTLPTGLGRLVAHLPVPHDGTVAVEETRLPEASERRELRVSHFGLLLSPTVARQTAVFLHTGEFHR